MNGWLNGRLVVLLAVAIALACGGESRRERVDVGDDVGGSFSSAGMTNTSGREAGVGGTGGDGGLTTTPLSGGAAGLGLGGRLALGAGGGSVTAGRSGADGHGGLWGGQNPVPLRWKCSVLDYDDGVCDCGCGLADPDCGTSDIALCDRCNLRGSCSKLGCPGDIDPEDTSRCLEVPSAWTCPARDYGDHQYCDCGCGIPDPDCSDAQASSCDRCTEAGTCANGPCPSNVDANDNARCWTPAPWFCPVTAYGDGVCDCNCGSVDMDCPSAESDVCERCVSGTWGCAGSAADACAGIAPDHNNVCEVPVSWTCPAAYYNDGSICDCGCAGFDPDCGSTELTACDRCDAHGSCSDAACPGSIISHKNMYCVEDSPATMWRCDLASFLDNRCDCGCGFPDYACYGGTSDVCEGCDACGGGDCRYRVRRDDNTECEALPITWLCDDARYADGSVCDCGCGDFDPDCASLEADACERCPSEGCAADDCSLIEVSDNTRCSQYSSSVWHCPSSYYRDGICDCGCGKLDPDCADGARSSCEVCDAVGSCSTERCPGTVARDDNSTCDL